VTQPDPISFLHETTFADLPTPVRHQAARCLVDLCGAIVAGRRTRLSAIVRDHAATVYGGNQATILLDGRRVSAPGAALATGMSIDAFDIHDSHRESLGHAGVHVLSTLLAVAELRASRGHSLPSGSDLVTAMVIGYDIACRAGEALHATVTDYHTSGAWGAVSSAALYARLVGLDREQTREALGIAEYHGPRSQMMRCIDHPTMVKDGSGWGAMTGVQAGMLAESGFTGAPAVTIEDPSVAPWFESLGSRWYVMEQGFKAHGSCWWAQPAIEATLGLVRANAVAPCDIAGITIETFEKATHLDHPTPATTEQAQYSLPFPVAAAVLKGSRGDDGWYGLGPDDMLEEALGDPEVRRLATAVRLVEAADLTMAFPERFLARVTMTLVDGRTLVSPDTTFRGELDDPLTDADLSAKYRWLAAALLEEDRVDALEAAAWSIADAPSIEPLLQMLAAPPTVAVGEDRAAVVAARS
jgi:2-methylcitrate dehydratase PrpD